MTRAVRINLGLILLPVLGLAMLKAYVTPPVSALRIDVGVALASPSLSHPLGTDHLGRDLLIRSLVGTSNSLIVSGLALVIACCLGSIIGTAIGFWDCAWIRNSAQLFIDVILSIPPMIVLIAMIAVLGGGMVQAFLVIGMIGSGPLSRVFAAEARRVAARDYILSDRILGFPNACIWIQSIVPESLRGAIPYIALYAVELIGIEAGLGFLGLSIQPPRPSLGSMIFEGLNHVTSSVWLLLAPVLFLIPCLLSINLFAQSWLSRRSMEGDPSGGC